MTRDEVLKILRDHAAELRARGIAGAAIFGSMARGHDRPDSDVDVVVDVPGDRKFSLLDLAGVRLLLCDLFGRETDVVVREDLRPRFRAAIDRESIRAF